MEEDVQNDSPLPSLRTSTREKDAIQTESRNEGEETRDSAPLEAQKRKQKSVSFEMNDSDSQLLDADALQVSTYENTTQQAENLDMTVEDEAKWKGGGIIRTQRRIRPETAESKISVEQAFKQLHKKRKDRKPVSRRRDQSVNMISVLSSASSGDEMTSYWDLQAGNALTGAEGLTTYEFDYLRRRMMAVNRLDPHTMRPTDYESLRSQESPDIDPFIIENQWYLDLSQYGLFQTSVLSYWPPAFSEIRFDLFRRSESRYVTALGDPTEEDYTYNTNTATTVPRAINMGSQTVFKAPLYLDVKFVGQKIVPTVHEPTSKLSLDDSGDEEPIPYVRSLLPDKQKLESLDVHRTGVVSDTYFGSAPLGGDLSKSYAPPISEEDLQLLEEIENSNGAAVSRLGLPVGSDRIRSQSLLEKTIRQALPAASALFNTTPLTNPEDKETFAEHSVIIEAAHVMIQDMWQTLLDHHMRLERYKRRKAREKLKQQQINPVISRVIKSPTKPTKTDQDDEGMDEEIIEAHSIMLKVTSDPVQFEDRAIEVPEISGFGEAIDPEDAPTREGTPPPEGTENGENLPAPIPSVQDAQDAQDGNIQPQAHEGHMMEIANNEYQAHYQGYSGENAEQQHYEHGTPLIDPYYAPMSEHYNGNGMETNETGLAREQGEDEVEWLHRLSSVVSDSYWPITVPAGMNVEKSGDADGHMDGSWDVDQLMRFHEEEQGEAYPEAAKFGEDTRANFAGAENNKKYNVAWINAREHTLKSYYPYAPPPVSNLPRYQLSDLTPLSLDSLFVVSRATHELIVSEFLEFIGSLLDGLLLHANAVSVHRAIRKSYLRQTSATTRAFQIVFDELTALDSPEELISVVVQKVRLIYENVHFQRLWPRGKKDVFNLLRRMPDNPYNKLTKLEQVTNYPASFENTYAGLQRYRRLTKLRKRRKSGLKLSWAGYLETDDEADDEADAREEKGHSDSENSNEFNENEGENNSDLTNLSLSRSNSNRGPNQRGQVRPKRTQKKTTRAPADPARIEQIERRVEAARNLGPRELACIIDPRSISSLQLLKDDTGVSLKQSEAIPFPNIRTSAFTNAYTRVLEGKPPNRSPPPGRAKDADDLHSDEPEEAELPKEAPAVAIVTPPVVKKVRARKRTGTDTKKGAASQPAITDPVLVAGAKKGAAPKPAVTTDPGLGSGAKKTAAPKPAVTADPNLALTNRPNRKRKERFSLSADDDDDDEDDDDDDEPKRRGRKKAKPAPLRPAFKPYSPPTHDADDWFAS